MRQPRFLAECRKRRDWSGIYLFLVVCIYAMGQSVIFNSDLSNEDYYKVRWSQQIQYRGWQSLQYSSLFARSGSI